MWNYNYKFYLSYYLHIITFSESNTLTAYSRDLRVKKQEKLWEKNVYKETNIAWVIPRVIRGTELR